MKKNELKLLWPFYATSFIAGSFAVALPVWIIFLQKHFSFVHISFAVSLQAVAGILFEIPTGAVADTYGRKKSVVLGIVLQGLLWLALPFVRQEPHLYALFFLMGALRTLESGADKAWVVDWLRQNRRGNLVREMFIKTRSLSSAGFVISSLLAAFLLLYFDLQILFFVQGTGYLIESACLFLFAREKVRRRKRRRLALLFREASRTTRKGFAFLFDNRPLCYLVAATTFAACTKDFGCIAWQPLLVNLSLPAERLGIVFSICSLTGIVTPFFVQSLLQRVGGERHFLSLTTFAEFVFLVSLYFVSKPYLPLGLFLYLSVSVLSDLQSPVGSICFQSLIPGRIRATMGSVQSMILATFSLVINAVGGYAMDTSGPRLAVVYFAFFLIPAAVFYLMIKRTAGRPLARVSH